MASDRDKWVVPRKAVDLEEITRRFPTLRQSFASSFDDCELSALFQIKYENGWSTHPQARGTLFHRYAAEVLRTMREQDTEEIPIGVARELLEEVCYQRGIPARDRVRVPLRELPDLEMAAIKFARDNRFTVRNIVAIERRLEAELDVPHWQTGEVYHRKLTGQIDALIARPPDEAVVLDWKDTWMLPPEHEEDADRPGLSYHGYFQQWWYAWLVMRTFPAVQAVVLREFYVRRTKARPARVTRQDLPRIEQRLRYLISALDRALASGQPRNLKLRTLDEHGSWKPSPGKHCHWCAASPRCPVEELVRGDGGIETPEDAAKWAAVRTVAKAAHKRADAVLMPYADLHGPIPIKNAKGRRLLGYRKIANGKTRWDEFTPDGSDRPPDESTVPRLEEAMRQSVKEAREGR